MGFSYYGKKTYNGLYGLMYDNIETLLYLFGESFPLRPAEKADSAAKGTERGLLRLYAGKRFRASEVTSFLWEKLLIISLAEDFSAHSDLVKMNENLKSASSDGEYRINKLHEMYKNFYTGDFNKNPISAAEFGEIVQIADETPVIRADYENFKGFLTGIIPNRLRNHYSYAEIIECLNDPDLREEAKRGGRRGTNKFLYAVLAKCLAANYGIKGMVSLIINFPPSVAELDRLQYGYEMERERQRLLSGDMDYEKNVEAMKMSLSQVTTGIGFEEFLLFIFTKIGYVASATKASGDRGADLILEKCGAKYVIQAKLYSGPVGNKAVQEVYTAKDIYKASGAAIITNSAFTRQAVSDAAATGIALVSGERLQRLISAAAQGGFYDIFETI